MHVPFHSAAERRIELGEIADFHRRDILTTSRSRREASVRDYPFSALRYFSASIAAAQPEPAAVIACL